MRTIEQQRAEHALKQVKSVLLLDYKKEFRSYVRAFPSKIVLFGLGNAVATELSSAGRKTIGDVDRKAHEELIRSIFKWIEIRKQISFNTLDSPNFGLEVLGYLTSLDQEKYFLIQREVLAYLNWLKKYVQALIEKEESTS